MKKYQWTLYGLKNKKNKWKNYHCHLLALITYTYNSKPPFKLISYRTALQCRSLWSWWTSFALTLHTYAFFFFPSQFSHFNISFLLLTVMDFTHCLISGANLFLKWSINLVQRVWANVSVKFQACFLLPFSKFCVALCESSQET